MKRTLTALLGITLLATLCISVTATAQHASEIEQKYPKVHAYLVRPDILLTAKFGSDGRTCEMVLEPRRWTEEKIVVSPTPLTLSENETIDIVEQIVPKSERGERPTDIDSLATVDGGTTSKTYQYENITISFYGSARREKDAMVVAYMVAVVNWRNRSCK